MPGMLSAHSLFNLYDLLIQSLIQQVMITDILTKRQNWVCGVMMDEPEETTCKD